MTKLKLIGITIVDECIIIGILLLLIWNGDQVWLIPWVLSGISAIWLIKIAEEKKDNKKWNYENICLWIVWAPLFGPLLLLNGIYLVLTSQKAKPPE